MFPHDIDGGFGALEAAADGSAPAFLSAPIILASSTSLVDHAATYLWLALDAVGFVPAQARKLNARANGGFTNDRARKLLQPHVMNAASCIVDGSRIARPEFDDQKRRAFVEACVERTLDVVLAIEPFGITPHDWGDMLLDEPNLAIYIPNTIEGRIRALRSWIPDYGLGDENGVFANFVKTSPKVLRRDPDAVRRHFELALAVFEIAAHRSDRLPTPRLFKEAVIARILKDPDIFTLADENYLLRLALKAQDKRARVDFRTSRIKVEKEIVTAMGGNPDDVVVRRIHSKPEQDPAVCAYLQGALRQYGQALCMDIRERWAQNAVPESPIHPILKTLGQSITFVKAMTCPVTHGPALLERVVLAGLFLSTHRDPRYGFFTPIPR